jgi:hypothetical protein
VVPQADEGRKSRKHSRLSCLRRRRRHHPPKAGDDSDLSEGFESDSSHDSAQASDGSDSGSDKSLEGRGTAFDAETDSEMNSQESRSDLEDMEDEEGTRSPAQEPPQARSEVPDSLNGPLGPSEASIASNLQAMSTQMFQTKRCFRLAPTFSNLLLQPTTEPNSVASHRPCVNGDMDKPLEPGAWVHESPPSRRVTSPLGLCCHCGILVLCTYSFPASRTFAVLLLSTADCSSFTLFSPHIGGCTSFPHGIQLPEGSQKLGIMFL